MNYLQFNQWMDNFLDGGELCALQWMDNFPVADKLHAIINVNFLFSDELHPIQWNG